MSNKRFLCAYLVLAILVSGAMAPLAQPSVVAANLTTSGPPLVETHDPFTVGAYAATLEGFLTDTTVPPSVTTSGPSDVSTTSAFLNGNLTSRGSASSVACYFEWGLTTAYGNITLVSVGGGIGGFGQRLDGLSENTVYHFRAMAVGDGTAYGDDLAFITSNIPLPPRVTTGNATSVTFAFARLNGTLSSLGTAFPVYVTFQYGTASGAYAYETPYQERRSTGDFVADIYGLPGTTYYYRAKAVAAGIGTYYGDEMSFTTETPPPGSNCWAVIVGVADYQYSSDLRYPDDDAQELYNVLTPVWGEDHIRLLLNAQATKSAIQSAISSWLAPLEDADDTVLLFFSGHGGYLTYDQPPIDEADGRDEYIVPHDARYVEDMILDDELNSWLSSLESVRQVAIIDSCYSGGFIGGDFARDLSKTGRVVITATEEDEVGWETSDLGHCVFSYYLLDGFEHLDVLDADGNNEISAEELFAYAQPRTTEYESTHDYESIQHPQIYDGYAGELGLINLATLTIDASARVTSLTLDGQTYSPPDLPVSVDFLRGTSHTFTFSVATTIDSVEQTKYTFLSWDDGVTSATRTVDISESTSYVANYKTRYYLTVQSEHGNPQGSGWYDHGTTAQFSVDSPISDGGDIRYLFDEWSDNSNGTNNPSTVIMDSPKTITAIWRTQCRLTVATSPSGVAPVSVEGWYDKGATFATETAASLVEGNPGTRYVFSSWSVDGTPVSGNPISVNIDSAHVVTALYTTQYELTVLSNAGNMQESAWYDAGSEADISVGSSSGVIVRRVFSGFAGDSSANTTDTSILMDRPKTVEALSRTDYTQLYILVAGILLVALVAVAVAMLVLRRQRHTRPLMEQPGTDA